MARAEKMVAKNLMRGGKVDASGAPQLGGAVKLRRKKVRKERRRDIAGVNTLAWVMYSKTHATSTI